MATVIDSLIVRLGLDPTEFRKGQEEADRMVTKTKESARKGVGDWESLSKRGDEFLGALQRRALGLAAIFLGGLGIQKALEHFTQLDTATLRNARIFNMSVETLSAWQSAIRTVGGTAEDVTASFQGIVSAIEQFRMARPSEMMAVFRSFGVNPLTETGEAIAPDVLLRQLMRSPEWQRASDARKREFANMLGMTPAMFNLLELGGPEVDKRLEQARQIGVLTKEQAEQAEKMQQAWSNMERSAENVGRVMLTWAAPGLTRIMNWMSNFFKTFGKDFNRSMELWSQGILGEAEPGEKTFSDDIRYQDSGFFHRRPTKKNLAEIETYIRDAAIKRGVDPDVAVAVAKSEGLYSYVGDRGSSFGPFQLHYGGVASGGMAVSGLGDEFTKATGLDARDPSTVKAQVDFALDQAAKGGWGPWHGWHGAQWAGIDRNYKGGGRETTVNVNGPINVTAKGDVNEIGRGIRGAIEAAWVVNNANSSPH